VQALALVLDPVQDRLAVRVVGHVGGHGQDVLRRILFGQLVARVLQRVLLARHKQQVRAQRSQLARDRQADAGAGAGHQCQLSVQPPPVRRHGRRIALAFIRSASMSATSATVRPLPFRQALCAIAFVATLAACRPEPPPTERPPEPQAQAHTELRDAIQAPQDKARDVEKTVQEAADRQQAEIDAATGG
jgi:hypothetical protein